MRLDFTLSRAGYNAALRLNEDVWSREVIRCNPQDALIYDIKYQEMIDREEDKTPSQKS